MDKITEIRIDEILDDENYYKNGEIKIIGKSSVQPQCFRQVARYLKWETIWKIRWKTDLLTV